MLYKGFKQDMIAMLGEFCGTTMFIFLGLGAVKTSQDAQTYTESQTVTTLSNSTILFISVGMGLSLLITAWVFYRITGGLFNPAVTLSLWLIGAVPNIRAALLVVAQVAGGCAGSGLIAVLTPMGGISKAITKLEPGVNKGQGLMLEAFLTAMLVFTVLMLAAEKHKATFMAPIGIGLTLFVCQLFGTLWTGCGMNPARSFGPSAISHQFPGEHWIYWVGPFIGSLIATGFYSLLKAFDYGSVVLGQDSDQANAVDTGSPIHFLWTHTVGRKRADQMAEGKLNEKNSKYELGQAEQGLSGGNLEGSQPGHQREDSRRSQGSQQGNGDPLQRYASPGTVAHPGGRYEPRGSVETGRYATRNSNDTMVAPSIGNGKTKGAPGSPVSGTNSLRATEPQMHVKRTIREA